jgi:hypothetical protein
MSALSKSSEFEWMCTKVMHRDIEGAVLLVEDNHGNLISG